MIPVTHGAAVRAGGRERLECEPGTTHVRAANERIVQHLHGRVRALVEKPIGEVAVGQRPGELQGADHQSEDRERVGPSGLDVGRVQARGDVVDLCRQFVGEDLSGGGGAAGDLVE